MPSRNPRLTRRSALKNMAGAGVAFPFVMKTLATAAPSETLYHASFGAAGMAAADIDSLTASPHLKLVAVADVDSRNLDRIKDPLSGREGLPGLASVTRSREESELGECFHARPYARLDHDAGLTARTACLHPETADPDNLRGATGCASGSREVARHADGNPDPLGRNSQDDRRDHSGRNDRQGEGSA